MQAKVWNDNKYPHSEMFKGDEVYIPAGSFIEMDYQEAIQFKGQMAPVKFNHDGIGTPETYKMIRVEPIMENAEEKTFSADTTCLACGEKLSDQLSLAKHILEKHSDSISEKSRDQAGENLQNILTKKKKG